MSPEVVVAEPPVLAQALVDLVSSAAHEAEAAGRRLSLALPGGSTAEMLLPPLARAAIDWTRANFFWGDERAVDPGHPDSNYGLAQRLFLGPIGADRAQVHRIEAEGPDLEAAATGYAARLASVLGQSPALDFVLMGMGPDGHVCSLFPGHAALREDEHLVLAISDSPKPPPRRVTLSMAALEAARVVCIAAFGEAKAEVLREALEERTSALPVALVARRFRRTVFLLDPPAAALLHRA